MDSLRREFDAAWTQFQSLDVLRLVPDTLESEWTRGHNSYLAFLVPIDSLDVVSHLRSLVRAIEHIPGVEPYPEAYWHVTIKGVGFESRSAAQPDEVSPRDFAQLVEAAGRVFASQPPFTVAVGRASGFPEVVFAEVWDSLPVRDLNSLLLAELPGLIRYAFDGENFLPHVSIARFTSDEGLAELQQALSALRGEDSAPSFEVREIELVRAHLSAATPRLETIETYRLGE